MKDKEYRNDLYEMLRLKQKLGITEDPEIPGNIKRQLRPSLLNYFESDLDHQRVARMTSKLRGKTDKYVFQMSHGSQQIKHYEPHKYKNHNNTPLRIRTRMIIHLAHQEPCEDIKERIRELHISYPYYLLKTEPINLRMLNYRFEEVAKDKDPIDIYLMVTGNKPNPETDELIYSVQFKPKKSLKFEYSGQDEQQFYAVNKRSKSLSQVLNFIWQDELQQIPEKIQSEKQETRNRLYQIHKDRVEG